MAKWVVLMVDYDHHYYDEDHYDDESQLNDDGVPFKPRSPLLTSRD